MKIMEQYIKKSALVAEIKRIEHETNYEPFTDEVLGKRCVCRSLLSFLDTLEVKDPYEQCVQYDSIKAGIQAHAETYSFNIESELFNQLTKEQQELWRKEIERACISGGRAGVELARDPRYKENLEEKDIDLELENDNPKITAGTKIRSKENPDIILRIISDDCHGDEFECSNGSVLSLKQIEKYYDII
jgi:hypothetical protein